MKTNCFVHYDLEKLKAISIRRVASQFGKVKHSGTKYVTLCPWHDDHDPSLSLVEGTGKNYCHCFSCDKGGDVIKFVEAAMHVDFRGACEWLSNQYGILTSSNISALPKQVEVQEHSEEPPTDYIPIELLDWLISVENSLCQILMRWFHPEAVKWFVEEYRIGCYSMYGHDNCTVYPSIDWQGRLCNLKVQCYDTNVDSPRFTHGLKNVCYWLAKIWKREGKLPVDGNYNGQCLFGEHLLTLYPARTVALVESPKNAIVGVLEHPELLWIAAGNKGMLQRKYMEPLSGRDVIVIPDCDAVDDWTKRISKMKDIANFKISDFCRQVAPEGQPKYDIADYIIDKHQRGISYPLGDNPTEL